jgi:hypothetical protein
MSSGFDTACRVTEFYAAFARVKELAVDFRANEKFRLSPASHCDSLDRQIDALIYDLFRLRRGCGGLDSPPSSTAPSKENYNDIRPKYSAGQ